MFILFASPFTIIEETAMPNVTQFRAACIALTMLMGAGCGGGSEDSADAGMAAVDEDSPEYIAAQYRQGLMQVLSFKVGTLRDMAEGAIDADAAVFAEYAADAAAVAGMVMEGFEGLDGSAAETLAGSAALPDIWGNWDDFTQKAADLAAAAEAVSAGANAPGFAVSADSAGPLEPVCGNCHRVYRQR